MAGENINRRLNIYINDKEVVNSLSGITKEMRKVEYQIKNLNAGTEDYDQQLAKLKNTYSQLEKEQAQFKSRLGETPGLLGKIKSALGPVATGMLAAFSVGALITTFVSKMREGWQIIVEFDQKQADLAAIMGKTRAQVAGLTMDSIKYGSSTAFSATQVTNLQIELAKLGKTEKEIKAMTASILSASTALDAELGPAAEFIGGQLNSFNAKASDSGKFADILANSVNISATSFESLSTSLPKTSKVAYLNGMSFEKLNAILGTLADESIAAETAGTGVRNILLESAEAGKPYEKMLEEIKNSSNQTAKATELFGKENATVAVILANSTEKINLQTKALENSAGAAEKLAKEKLNSLAGSTEMFAGAWEGFVLSIENGNFGIARGMKAVTNLGTAILGLITPTRRLSDELKDEQLNLNMLISKITSTNIKNDERKRLLIELKEEYPDLIGNIDIETVSNGELNKVLGKVNEQYIKRIALQKQAEKVEDAAKEQGDHLARELKWRDKLFQQLNEQKAKYGLQIPIDYNNLEASAKKVTAFLKEQYKKEGKVWLGDLRAIEASVSQMKTFAGAASRAADEVDKETDALERQSSAFGINTEAQNAAIKADKEAVATREELIKQATAMGMDKARENTTAEIKLWIAQMEEKKRYSGEMSEDEKKKREKAIADAKKHAEDLLKQEADLQKQLLDIKRAAQDLDNGLIQEDYLQERAIINAEFNRKIEDTKANIAKEQQEIEKLQSAISSKGTTKEDLTSFKKQLASRLEIQAVYNDTLVSLEQTRQLKIGALQEKHLNDHIKLQKESHDRELELLKSRQELELSSFTSLQDAKQYLENFLTEKELKGVTTLEQAKSKIKEQHLKDQYAVQERYLIDSMAGIQKILNDDEAGGFELISEEQRQILLAFLDEAAIKLNRIKAGGNSDEGAQENPLKALSGIDLLGFTPEQWESAFSSLDTFAGKIDAVRVVTGAMHQAFGMFFSFLDAADQKSVQKFERNTQRKKSALSDQLEKGYITQEVFTARSEKLDQELERKKAESEYKQAKRQRVLQAGQIVASTAQAIMSIWAQVPKFDFGVSAGVLTGMVSALGAAKLGLLMSQPLPSKTGYKVGGFTPRGNPNDEVGPVHKDEYVVPQHVLYDRSDPVVPAVIDYLESKRTGSRSTVSSSSDLSPASVSSGNSSSADSSLVPYLASVIDRNSDILEKVYDEGVAIELDIKKARKIQKKIKELEAIQNQSRS